MNEQPVLMQASHLWKVYGGSPVQTDRILNADASTQEKRQALRDAGAVVAVSDVSLSIRQGEILMLMGLSGSGKSTVLRCLSRLIEPSSGQISLENNDIAAMDRQRLVEVRRKKIGMVFQSFGLLPHLNVLDNIAFPLRVQGMDKAQRYARAREFVRLVQLEGRETSMPHQLSGGQQQRVGIARSLATDPDLWLLDEPFSALDPMIRRQMQDEFMRLQAQLNKTIVFVTHDFAEAARLADRIAIMRNGALVQVGTPAQLLFSPADAYVSDFAKDVPMLDIVTAKMISVKAQQAIAPDVPRVSPDTPLKAMLATFVAGAGCLCVEGAEPGIIERSTINRILEKV